MVKSVAAVSELITEVVVVGGGPAGLTAAVALADAGVATALVAMPATSADNRTTALLAGSVTALDRLGVWADCAPRAAPLDRMRIVDDTPRLLRAPEVVFDAGEISLPAFGYNIENRHLVASLERRARALPALSWIPGKAVGIASAQTAITVSLDDRRQIVAKLTVAADGRRSLCRTAAGIATDCQSYPQTALTINFAHARPHNETATEFHTASGPFTVVPLPEHRSSLVWVVDPVAAPRLSALPDPDLAIEIERRSHSLLGKVTVEPGRGAFPLAVEIARSFRGDRMALVGEAGHVMPPIGAQGLNLGLRDAATIVELVTACRREGGDIGSPALLARYEHMRRADVMSRSMAVDLLNRSLLSDLLPVQGLRGLGLYLLDRVGPLRRAVMREGVAPAASQPRLMRGDTL
ncbi:MAG: UbiH/UbiF family hydroxylase [Hyphomicrobiales bacterium]|nr:UbiH/UbiF family hydroxylase [Hyphomicrobiales bacterium]